MLRHAWAVAAAVLVLAVYAAVLSIMPKEAFWSPDEGAKFIQAHSIAWRNGFQYAIPYGAARLDPEYAFYPTRCRFEDIYPVQHSDGTVGFHWPIWFPLVTSVFVRAFGPVGLYVIPLVSGWLVAVLAGYFMAAWSAALAPVAILAVGLATPIAFFSLTFWEHTLATLLGLSALAMVVATPPPRPLWTVWVIAPILLVAAVLRVELLLFGVAVLCAWYAAGLWGRDDGSTASSVRVAGGRSIGRVVVLAVVVAGVVALVFGGTIVGRHRWLLRTAPEHLGGSVLKLPYLIPVLTAILIDTSGNQAPVIPNVWRYATALACLAAAWAPRMRTLRAEALLLFAALSVVFNFSLYLILRPESYISLHGFLPITPIIVLAPYAVIPVWRQRRYRQLAVALAGAMYAVLALATIFIFQVSGDGVLPTGLEWGNRYLFTLYPIGIVLALAALYEYRRSARPPWLKRAFVGAGVVLLLCGLLLQVRGVWMLVESRRLVTTWQTALRGGPPVVTDVWWLPAAMAPLFMSHEVQCIRQAGDLEQWFAVAAQHGVDTVTFAGFRRLDTIAIPQTGFDVTREDEEVVSGLRLTRLRFVKRDS